MRVFTEGELTGAIDGPIKNADPKDVDVILYRNRMAPLRMNLDEAQEIHQLLGEMIAYASLRCVG